MLSFNRLRVLTENTKKEKTSDLLSADKDRKFEAGLLLRNVTHLLSLPAISDDTRGAFALALSLVMTTQEV